MRVALVAVSGLLCMAIMSCMPFQQIQLPNPSVMNQAVVEQGRRIDEVQAKNIQTAVHTKQDIEMWFGKPEEIIPLDDPMINPSNVQDPHGCSEMWSYTHTIQSAQMGMETLHVLFKKDEKVCRWSLMRKLMDMRDSTSILGRPIAVEKTRSIQTGVQSEQDIETWFGKPESIGFGDQPGDPKGCLDLWEYSNMTSNQGRSGGTLELLRVKFNEQGKVCHSDYVKRTF